VSSARHFFARENSPNSFVFKSVKFGAHPALFVSGGHFMQMVITFMAVVAGLIFSVAVALLAEELIFGQVFRLFFARHIAQPLPVKAEQKR